MTKKNKGLRKIIIKQARIINKLIKENNHLQHYRDSTVGLWAIDKDPITQSHLWIIDNAFKLQSKTKRK
jgi:hypothetical protein